MTSYPELGFSPEQNRILLAVGQYVYAFSFLDMALTFALCDRISGNAEAVLVTLRGMDFRVRYERLFKVSKSVDRTPLSSSQIEDFDRRLKAEYSYRNDIVHSQIGINTDGTAFLNSFGKGFGQARHTTSRIDVPNIEKAVQRCWSLFREISEAFSPQRHAAFSTTLLSA